MRRRRTLADSLRRLEAARREADRLTAGLPPEVVQAGAAALIDSMPFHFPPRTGSRADSGLATLYASASTAVFAFHAYRIARASEGEE